MTSRHLSLRLERPTYERLEAESRRAGQNRSELARTLLEEGLRMRAHPGIVFRPGPAGRRPGLAAGPDVWEVVRVFKQLKGSRDEAVAGTAEWMDLTTRQVQTALRYYSAFREEIDAWIGRVEAEAEEAERAWLREQELLRG